MVENFHLWQSFSSSWLEQSYKPSQILDHERHSPLEHLNWLHVWFWDTELFGRFSSFPSELVLLSKNNGLGKDLGSVIGVEDEIRQRLEWVLPFSSRKTQPFVHWSLNLLIVSTIQSIWLDTDVKSCLFASSCRPPPLFWTPTTIHLDLLE